MNVRSSAGRGLAKVVGPRRKRRIARTFDAWVANLYRGHVVECPCCGRAFRSFKGYDGSAQCRSCGALERHRMLWLYLSRESDLFAPGRKVLHVAPEHGIEQALRRRLGLEYVTTDLDPAHGDVVADIADMPFPDERFDVVICSHVLEFVPDMAAALSEMYRVLVAGGVAFLMAPVDYGQLRTYEDPSITDPEARLTAFSRPGWVRVHGADHVDRLRGAGFEVEVNRYLERLDPRVVEQFVLRPPPRRYTTDEIFVCRKPA
jgi:SAM-dependent methyltransferase